MDVNAARLQRRDSACVGDRCAGCPDAPRSASVGADRQAVARDTACLDAERIVTRLGAVLVTSAEQTVLDLTKHPGLGDAQVEVWPLWSSCIAALI